jgi:hypothetical protein
MLNMGLINEIEIRPLTSIKGGMAEFYTPQSSHETMLVQIAPKTLDDLFVHRFQTDQLLVVREVLCWWCCKTDAISTFR